MGGHDLEFEESHIPEAVGLPFHGLDLVVGAFQGASGDRVIIVGQEPTLVRCEGICKTFEHGDS